MNDQNILVMGAGNLMRRDDGIGPFVIDQLRNEPLPSNVILKDAGTDGLSMIDAISEFNQIVVIDAVDLNQRPGDIRIFTPAELKSVNGADSLSTHGFSLADLFELMRLLGYRAGIKIIGVQPEDIGYGNGFSEALGARVSELMEIIKNTLQNLQPALPPHRPSFKPK